MRAGSGNLTGKKRQNESELEGISKGQVRKIIDDIERRQRINEDIIRGNPLIMKFAKLLDITADNGDNHDSSKNHEPTDLTDERKPSANDSESDSDMDVDERKPSANDSDSDSDMDVDERKPSAKNSNSDMDVVKEQKSTKNDTILNKITEEMNKMNIQDTKTKGTTKGTTIFGKIASLFNTKPKVPEKVHEEVSFPKSIKLQNITSIEDADSFFKEGRYYLLTNETLANETLAKKLSEETKSFIISKVRLDNNEEPEDKINFLNEKGGRGIYEGSFKGAINTEEGIILLFLSGQKMKNIVIDEQKKTKKINEIVIKALQILNILIRTKTDIFVVPKNPINQKKSKKLKRETGESILDIDSYKSIIDGNQSIFHGENGIHGVNENWKKVLVSFRENKPNESGITPMQYLEKLIEKRFVEKIELIQQNDVYLRLVQQVENDKTNNHELKNNLSRLKSTIQTIALGEKSINISILEAFFELYRNHNNNEIKSQEFKNRIKESWLINTHGLEIYTLLEHYSTIHVQQFSNFYISEYLNRLHWNTDNEEYTITHSMIEYAATDYKNLNELSLKSTEILEIFTQQPKDRKFYFCLKATNIGGINKSVSEGNIQRALDNLFIANKSQTPEISFLDGSLGGGSLIFCGLFHQGKFHKITMNHNGFNTETKDPENNKYYIETKCKFLISAIKTSEKIFWIQDKKQPSPTIKDIQTHTQPSPTIEGIQYYINQNRNQTILNNMIDKILKSPTGKTAPSDAKSPTGRTAPSVGALKSPTGRTAPSIKIPKNPTGNA
jgi:hypothetical protein